MLLLTESMCFEVSSRYSLRVRDCGTTGHGRRSPVAAMKKSYFNSRGVWLSLSATRAVLVSRSTLLMRPWIKWTFGLCRTLMFLNSTHAFSAYSLTDNAKGDPMR